MSVTNIHKAKTNLSQLIDAAERGEDVIIARDGKPVVRMVPVVAVGDAEMDTPGKRLCGSLIGKVTIIDPDWWKPDDDLADLFENSKLFPDDPDAP